MLLLMMLSERLPEMMNGIDREASLTGAIKTSDEMRDALFYSRFTGMQTSFAINTS